MGKSLTTGDAALNWAERIAKWIAWGVSGGVFSSIAGIVVGFLTGNPLSGLVIGVVAGMVILVAFAVHAVRVAAAGAPSQGAVEESRKQREIQQRTAAESRRLERQNESLQEQVEELTAERDELLDRLQVHIESLEHQPGDDELKGECFQTSAVCYQFVRDHGGTEIGDYLDPEVRRRNDAVMLEYEQSLGGRVNGLLRRLQRRGWWQPETVDPKKRKHIEDPGFLSDVQDIAKELNAIGHEH